MRWEKKMMTKFGERKTTVILKYGSPNGCIYVYICIYIYIWGRLDLKTNASLVRICWVVHILYSPGCVGLSWYVEINNHGDSYSDSNGLWDVSSMINRNIWRDPPELDQITRALQQFTTWTPRVWVHTSFRGLAKGVIGQKITESN